MINTDSPGLTITTFIPHLHNAMEFAVNHWNNVKLSQFEEFYEISFENYMARHHVSQQTQERTKVVSPPFCSILNNHLAESLGEAYAVEETVGSDLQIHFNEKTRLVEQKLTTATGEGGFSWTGNHVSNKSGWHMLIRTKHATTGIITDAYAGMLDYDAATSSYWKGGSGSVNFGDLTVYRADEKHLHDAIGAKQTDYPPNQKKVKFLLQSFNQNSI